MNNYTLDVPVLLTHDEVEEFQQITFKLYKRKLTYEEAEDQLTRMVQMFELIIKNKDKFDTDNHIENNKQEEQNDNQ